MTLQALVPLVTYPDPHKEAAAANAAAIARLIGANMHALALRVDIPSISNALSRALINLPEMIDNAERQSGHSATALLGAVGSAAAEGFTVTTESVIGQPVQLGDIAARHARYFDIALIGIDSRNPGTIPLAEAVLFGSGRPLVAFPEAQAAPSAIDHVVVAWDGSRVAARALADARPFIERARAVSVVSVVDEKPLEDRNSGETLANRLRLGGVDATFTPLRAAGKQIAAALQDHAADQDAQLLVMGGFGHSRLRDFVVGGATAGVLADLKMPVLLSH